MNGEWIEAIMYSYSHLDITIKDYEQVAMNRATYNQWNTRTMFEYEKLTNYLIISNKLKVLKHDIDTVLRLLSPEERMLIDYKYFRCVEEIELPYTKRTFFRKQLALKIKLEKYFKLYAITEKTVTEEMKDISLIYNKYLTLKNGKHTTDKRKKTGIKEN